MRGEVTGLHPPQIEYVGEVDEREKRDFLADALALLFPISWSEPFGMVMIEAMATGTPVLAFPVGSTTELVEDGLSGYLCADPPGMAKCVDAVYHLDRRAIRSNVAQRFSAKAMADAYEATYRRLLASFGRLSRVPQRPIPVLSAAGA